MICYFVMQLCMIRVFNMKSLALTNNCPLLPNTLAVVEGTYNCPVHRWIITDISDVLSFSFISKQSCLHNLAELFVYNFSHHLTAHLCRSNCLGEHNAIVTKNLNCN